MLCFVAEHVCVQGLSPWLLQLFLFTVSVQASFLLRQVSEDIHIELTFLVGVAVPHFGADDGHNHESDFALCLFSKNSGLSEAFKKICFLVHCPCPFLCVAALILFGLCIGSRIFFG